jgi:SNF2 family DNA or RNA helicase
METQKVPALAASPPPSFFATIPDPFDHQRYTSEFYVAHPRVFDMSDPGTGKTRAALDGIVELKKQGLGRTLILAPKSILEPAWGSDIRKFTPSLSYSIATAPKRAKAFAANTDIVITNHDAATWLADNDKLLNGFDLVIMDEITAYKHRTSARSKAMAKIAKKFERRAGLTGTPIANDLLHIWHQAFLIDDGNCLGSSYFRFRSAVCEPTNNGPFTDWVEKPGARDAVADALSPITVRHKFEDCTDIPPNTQNVVSFNLNAQHWATYQTMLRKSLIEVEGKVIDAVHAAALTNKLLQICAGSVYDSGRNAGTISTERYELVMQLVEEREQCVVAFHWKHQRDHLVELAQQMGMTYAVIDGDNPKDHRRVVDDFQAGKLKVIFAQPQSAAHGLTLTRGTTTIWASPTSDAERFTQFNRRIYRTTQTKKTETIVIVANGTIEDRVYYDVLSGRVANLAEMLALVQTDLKAAA